MIEAMKQALEALEDVGVLTDREWQAVHKNKANELRQAIREHAMYEVQRLGQEIEQEPDKYAMDIECTKCGAKQSGVLTVNTHPPQRTWVGLTGEMLLKAAQSSLSPEQYDHFEAMSKYQPDIYDRLAYAIRVQDE